MKGRVIVVDRVDGVEAAALVEDGMLQDLLIASAEDHPAPGAIYRGIVERPMKGQGGVILRLPGGTAFLRQTKGLAPGQPLLVQVTGHAEAGKAVLVTTRLLLKGRHAIVTPDAPGRNVSRQIRDDDVRVALLEIAHEIDLPEKTGLILRSAAGDADPAAVRDEAARLAELAATILSDIAGGAELLVDGPGPADHAWRDWPLPDLLDNDPGAFARHGVDALVDDMRRPDVALKGGAWMSVEPTRALVAVDVNTGGDTSPAAGLKANIAAARDLPRQLRCRGLGGQITVDFAPMSKKERPQLEQILRSALRADPVETSLAGWTPLSHFELQRKRERRPLGSRAS